MRLSRAAGEQREFWLELLVYQANLVKVVETLFHRPSYVLVLAVDQLI